jgi:hypothetical protein
VPPEPLPDLATLARDAIDHAYARGYHRGWLIGGFVGAAAGVIGYNLGRIIGYFAALWALG